MAGGAVLGKILQIVGGLAGTAGQLRSGLSRAQQLRFEGKMALRNAGMVEQDIAIVKEASIVERANIAKEAHQLRGAGRVSFAAGNVAVDEGSALDFDVAAAEQAAAEEQRSRDAEALAVHKLETERQGLLAESQMKRRAFRSAKGSARLGAVGGVLQTVGGAAGSFGGK
jgi:hypothetical protein